MKENQCLKQTIDEAVDAKSKEDGEPNGPKRLPRQKHSAHLAVFATASVLSWRLMTEWYNQLQRYYWDLWCFSLWWSQFGLQNQELLEDT